MVRTGRAARRRTIRAAAFMNMFFGVLAILSLALATNRATAVWIAAPVGIGLILWGAIDAWAVQGRHLEGTKLVAMFMAIFGFVLIGSAIVFPENIIYRGAIGSIGVGVVAVSLVDAFVSPTETRRKRFGPRARPPVP